MPYMKLVALSRKDSHTNFIVLFDVKLNRKPLSNDLVIVYHNNIIQIQIQIQIQMLHETGEPRVCCLQ